MSFGDNLSEIPRSIHCFALFLLFIIKNSLLYFAEAYLLTILALQIYEHCV